MKRLKKLVMLTTLLLAMSSINAQSPEGFWTTIDDETGEKRALVHLTVDEGILHGVIEKVFAQQGDTGICTKCPGEFHGKQIVGLRFLWGLTETKHDIWTGGHILEAKTGKIYQVQLKVDQDKLYVRGYVGTALLGRTQVWVR